MEVRVHGTEKRGKASNRSAGNQPSRGKALTFGQLLSFHLERGTRPEGKPGDLGERWTAELFGEKLGVEARSVRNWLADRNLPSAKYLALIEGGLFGDNPVYAEERAELRHSHGSARRAESRDAENAVPEAIAPSALLPTKPLRCLGRDDELKAVVEALLGGGQGATAVLVLGGPGMGKTTITREAASDLVVVDRFGNRRWFVELETAIDAQTFVAAIIKGLGLDPAAAKFADALALLGRGPGLLVLDNMETPWDAARDEIERLLTQLHQVPTLALLASIRGNEPPGGLRWTRQKTMHPLEWPHDRELFLDIAQDIKGDDPALEPLLKELGGIPLAVELIAQQAAAHDALSAVLDEWRRIGSALAKRRGVEASRLTSLEISLELSVNSTRLSNAGRRLFAILGQLPAGIVAEDLSVLLGDSSFEARHGLVSCGLAVERGRRLDLLPPVRDHARRLHAPADREMALVQRHFIRLARDHGKRMATVAGIGSTQRLAAELPNITAALSTAPLNEPESDISDVLRGFAASMAFTGLGTPSTIRNLYAAYEPTNKIECKAHCMRWLGYVQLGRFEHAAAREAYQLALELYRQVGQIGGEADCIRGLGDIALERSDHEAARNAFEQALPLYRRVGQILGEANCIQSLGDIALRHSDHEGARGRYFDALSLYERISEPYSIGHAHRRLAAISNGEARDRHLAVARRAWTSIDRGDLVELLKPADRPPTKDKGSRRRAHER
jgi:tetratricopeptide (TPR) repeat protein